MERELLESKIDQMARTLKKMEGKPVTIAKSFVALIICSKIYISLKDAEEEREELLETTWLLDEFGYLLIH